MAKKGKKVSKISEVKIVSGDERELSCQIQGVKYEGHSIMVPAEREAGIRSVLVSAGYVLE